MGCPEHTIMEEWGGLSAHSYSRGNHHIWKNTEHYSPRHNWIFWSFNIKYIQYFHAGSNRFLFSYSYIHQESHCFLFFMAVNLEQDKSYMLAARWGWMWSQQRCELNANAKCSQWKWKSGSGEWFLSFAWSAKWVLLAFCKLFYLLALMKRQGIYRVIRIYCLGVKVEHLQSNRPTLAFPCSTQN